MEEKINRCSCGAAEGEFHVPGCCSERCPFCGGQLISCDCCYEKLGLFNRDKYRADTGYLPPRTYREGLTKSQQGKWDAILRKKALVPYIEYPLVCARCGDLWPPMFMVSDAEWAYYIPPDKRKSILCFPRYDRIRFLIDQAVGPFPGLREFRTIP